VLGRALWVRPDVVRERVLSGRDLHQRVGGRLWRERRDVQRL
jgi:hypothetical protein